MGKNLGDDGRNDDGAIGISSQDSQMYCGNNIKKGQRRGRGVGPGGRGVRSYRDLAYKGVREEVEGKNCGVCSMETEIRNL